jgi:sugar/nucleoside kinase (ribokinase family)
MALLVTGTIGIDTVHTPTASAERVLGGSCSYFSAAASFFGPVRMVAAVGGDWPQEHRQALESFSAIDTRGLEVRPASKTFAWGGRYHENMNVRETLFTELGVLEEAPPRVPATFSDSRFVFLGNTHPAVQLDLLRQCPQRRLAVADTMDLWINVAHPELLALLREVDGLMLNDSEAELLTEQRNPYTAARAILEMGPRFVVVKKGEHGAALVHRDGIGVVPAYPAAAHQVVDPTGAGDSFAGGLMGYLAQVDAHAGAAADPASLDSIRRGLAWGTVVASFTIESHGLDRLRSIGAQDVAARMEEFKRMSRVE